MKRFQVLSVVTSFLFLPNLYAQNSGLLLGIGHKQKFMITSEVDAGFAQRLHTLWIAPDNDSLKIIADLPELITPRDSGFWRIGLKRSLYNKWAEDFIWAIPVTEKPKMQGIDVERGERCDGESSIEILFLGNDYLSIKHSEGGFCEGYLNPTFGGTNYYMIPLDCLREPKEWVGECALKIESELKSIIGESNYQIFLDEGEELLSTLKDEHRINLMSTPTELFLFRQNGMWKFKGRYLATNNFSRGMERDFDVSIDPPKRFIGHDDLNLSWSLIKSRVSRANDAFTSPAGDILGVVSGKKVSIYQIKDGAIPKEPALTYIMDGLYEKVVMIQWATGTHVNRWSEFFKHLQSNFWKLQSWEW